MNAIISGFNGSTQPVINRLLDSNLFKNILIISFPEILDHNLKTFEFIDFIKLHDGRFFESVDWNFINPLSADLLDELSYVETEYYKIFRRSHPKLQFVSDARETYIKCLRYSNHLLQERQINILISANVPHEGFDFVLFKLAEYYKIKTIISYQMPLIPHKTVIRYILFNIHEQNEFFKADLVDAYQTTVEFPQFKDLRIGFQNYIEHVRLSTSKNFTRSNRNHSSLILLAKFISPISSIKRFIINKREHKYNTLKYLSLFIKTILKEFFKDYKKSKILKFYDKISVFPSFESPYLFFPLNYQPEASTIPLAGRYSDLDLIANLVANNLPKGIMLFIKEHPRMSLNRDRLFYEKLTSYDNVVLIKISANSHKLIKNSKAVVVTTGSAGLEAFVNKIPVIMFGSRIYQYAKGVYKIYTTEQLINALKSITSNEINISDRDIYIFFKSLEKYSTDSYLSDKDSQHSHFDDETNISNLSDLFGKFIEHNAH